MRLRLNFHVFFVKMQRPEIAFRYHKKTNLILDLGQVSPGALSSSGSFQCQTEIPFSGVEILGAGSLHQTQRLFGYGTI